MLSCTESHGTPCGFQWLVFLSPFGAVNLFREGCENWFVLRKSVTTLMSKKEGHYPTQTEFPLCPHLVFFIICTLILRELRCMYFRLSPYLLFVIENLTGLWSYSASGPTLEDDDASAMDTGSVDSLPGDDRPGSSRHDDGARRRRKRTKEQVEHLYSYAIAEIPMSICMSLINCRVCTLFPA